MCGYLALFGKDSYIQDNIEKAKKSSEGLFHRGPDSYEEYTNSNLYLGFSRLSIIDLAGGVQPYKSEDGKYAAVFNGEIYNYKELRNSLRGLGYEIKGNSEIEVIISAYKEYGEDFVTRLRGMFSITINDIEAEKIIAVRDYFGIKPLHYVKNAQGIAIASEMKALLDFSENNNINETAISNYVTYQYAPQETCIYEGIETLAPGSILTCRVGQEPKTRRYWEFRFSNDYKSDDDMKKEIVDVLRDSVEKHMISDVGCGTFLSGGIDSTIIAKLASEINPDIKSFTIGFDIEGYTEVHLAKKIAKDIGIDNISVNINSKDYIRELPKIIYGFDTPVADPSVVPLYYICKEARKHFKVMLSGEGSDELFGGYNIYTEEHSLRMFKNMPRIIKSMLLSIASIFPNGMKGKSFIERGCLELEDRYFGNAKIFYGNEKSKILSGIPSLDHRNITDKYYNHVENLSSVCKKQYIDMNTWLEGDILMKADRMSMINSLEVRVPFLDIEVAKVAAKLTDSQKLNGMTTKHLLREAFKGVIPDDVYTRRKLGYPVPIRVWLRGELYEWAYETIETSNAPYIDKKYALNLLKRHKIGREDNSRKIWTIIVYTIWYRIFIEKTMNKDDLIERASK